MPKVKITVRSVEEVAPSSADIILWDTEIPGFGCKITPTGRRVYFLYYRTASGQQRRPVIGQHGAIKPEQARLVARQWHAEITQGRDPSANRKARRAAPTVRELCERYLDEHARPRKKPRSVAEDERLIAKRVLPRLGSIKVDAVRHVDIVELHQSLKDMPYEANRVLALLSKVFGLAESWGHRIAHTNPVKGVEKYREHRRNRFLLPDELGRLNLALAEEVKVMPATPSVAPAIWLLILTGCRLSEVMRLKWTEVDLGAARLNLADSKTGAKTVHLSAQAVSLLRAWRDRMEDPSVDYVFPGKRVGRKREGAKASNRPLVNLQKPWRRIRTRAGLKDVRLHDLRHTYASYGAAAGLSLHAIGKLLGHAQAATTHRYAHLADDPAKQGADAIGVSLSKALGATLG